MKIVFKLLASLQALNPFNYTFPVVYPLLGALTTVKTAVKIPYLKHYILCFDIFQVFELLDYHFLLPVTRVSPRIY